MTLLDRLQTLSAPLLDVWTPLKSRRYQLQYYVIWRFHFALSVASTTFLQSWLFWLVRRLLPLCECKQEWFKITRTDPRTCLSRRWDSEAAQQVNVRHFFDRRNACCVWVANNCTSLRGISSYFHAIQFYTVSNKGIEQSPKMDFTEIK